MTKNEETVAIAAFITSLGHEVDFYDGDRVVQIKGPFDLKAALGEAFAAVAKHNNEAAIMRAKMAEEVVIFDP
ncbi:hypothetical protein [Microvirga mediterraneensis]|uniref:Uncharacterized protein n=1 Tax=Microvirga mediterraneensis TaxID=2754695 RepID=A0A838BPI1_9HYPH|nr:hypothetical protein [Microvirga mediterraneensis]MBA1156853.1 hypothetical protein [Microvirga mediterraneensis]